MQSEVYVIELDICKYMSKSRGIKEILHHSRT